MRKDPSLIIFTKVVSTMFDIGHKKLEVYKTALLLVKEVYGLTKLFPRDEQFVLVTQLRRAAISVCSNIAEGSARSSKAERKRFYEISRSSLMEIDAQFEIALMLHYIDQEDIQELEKCLGSTFRMLSKMINNLRI